MALVSNATAGVNAVLRSLDFTDRDELLVTNHTYAACRKAIDFVAARHGSRVVVAALPFPVRSEAEVIDAVLNCATRPDTVGAHRPRHESDGARVADRAARSGTEARGVDTLVDGAHAPGMVPLALAGVAVLATGLPLFLLGHRLFGGAGGSGDIGSTGRPPPSP